MKSIDIYLKSRGIDINSISGEDYQKLSELHSNWVRYNESAALTLREKSYSPYSTDYRYLEFSRLAEMNKAMLEDEVIRIKSKTRVKK